EFVSIMGPSGCGKSTLLNVLGLLDRTESGNYLFGTTELTTVSEKERSRFRKENMGFVFQNFNLIDELSVFENIELPLIYAKVNVKERRQRVEEMLERMNLTGRRNHFPQQLSGGQQQRVAVSRALINKPGLILADEPTGNLDSSHGNEVMELLCELNENGTTIVMVTHSPHDAGFSQRIIFLKDGMVLNEKVNKDNAAELI
ncbi:MAG TPA: ABC transporter ATP-binding protein, partial [Chitinophagaceae bacterium]|nr:ABC transporter ATP-binding protein [Chitinophagaceae bacterium]